MKPIFRWRWMMVRIVVAVSFGLLSTLATFAPPAYGWGDVGHMMVAYAAYQELTPAAKSRVNALVLKNPKKKDWVKLLPAGTSKRSEERRVGKESRSRWSPYH